MFFLFFCFFQGMCEHLHWIVHICFSYLGSEVFQRSWVQFSLKTSRQMDEGRKELLVGDSLMVSHLFSFIPLSPSPGDRDGSVLILRGERAAATFYTISPNIIIPIPKLVVSMHPRQVYNHICAQWSICATFGILAQLTTWPLEGTTARKTKHKNQIHLILVFLFLESCFLFFHERSH